MMAKHDDHHLRLIVKVYRWSLVAYPAPFRQRYGGEMVLVFGECCQNEIRARGMPGLFAMLFSAFGDLVITATRERLDEISIWFGRRGDVAMPQNGSAPQSSFADQVIGVLDREPEYYPLLLHIQKLHSVSAVADSLALDADQSDPSTTFTLFQELAEAAPADQSPHWLSRMCDIARRHFRTKPSPSDKMTDQLAHRIYSDSALFEMIAAEEIGAGMISVIESLALDGDVEDIESMMILMHELAAGG